jgi:hypothetical protein
MFSEKVKIELSNAEAIILFEFLSRFRNKEKLEIVDQAEKRVLWDILSVLESILTDPLKPNYLDLLEKARSEVRDEEF